MGTPDLSPPAEPFLPSSAEHPAPNSIKTDRINNFLAIILSIDRPFESESLCHPAKIDIRITALPAEFFHYRS
jgi:hypothetical protein